jgi:hypothetical protein
VSPGPAAGATPPATVAALVVTLALTAWAVLGLLARADGARVAPERVGPFLWLFLGLFALRVGGQLLVLRRAPRWLPPMEQWNLVPYRLLLPIQLVFLAVMGWIAFDLSRGTGLFARPRPALGPPLLWGSYLYAGVMAGRYAVRMRRRPDQRWFGGAIPIVFHFVLAAFALALGTYHASY